VTVNNEKSVFPSLLFVYFFRSLSQLLFFAYSSFSGQFLVQ